MRIDYKELPSLLYKYVHIAELFMDGKISNGDAYNDRCNAIEARIESSAQIEGLKVRRFNRTTGAIYLTRIKGSRNKNIYWDYARQYLFKDKKGNPFTGNENNYKRSFC